MKEEDLDIPQDIWDQAVAEVDAEHGYTLEFAPDSIAHRIEYRDRAEQLCGIPESERYPG